MLIQQDPTQQFLVRMLDATATRHKVLSNNLANAETPGFVRKDLPFEAELADAVQRNDVSVFNPSIQEDRVPPMRADGNNIAIDRELVEINKNALLHQMALQILQTKLSIERTAITGRT